MVDVRNKFSELEIQNKGIGYFNPIIMDGVSYTIPNLHYYALFTNGMTHEFLVNDHSKSSPTLSVYNKRLQTLRGRGTINPRLKHDTLYSRPYKH